MIIITAIILRVFFFITEDTHDMRHALVLNFFVVIAGVCVFELLLEI